MDCSNAWLVGGDKEPTQQRAAASSQPQQRFAAGQQVSSRAHLMDKGSAHSVFWSMHVKHAKPFRPPAAAGSSLLLPEQGQADLLEPLLKTESKHRCSQRPAREHSTAVPAALNYGTACRPSLPHRCAGAAPSRRRTGAAGRDLQPHGAAPGRATHEAGPAQLRPPHVVLQQTAQRHGARAGRGSQPRSRSRRSAALHAEDLRERVRT